MAALPPVFAALLAFGVTVLQVLASPPPGVLQEMTFTVPHDMLNRFLAADRRVWTNFLAAQPGFLGKQVDAQHERPAASNVTVVASICWSNWTAWKAIPPTELAEVAQKLNQEVGAMVSMKQSTWNIMRNDSASARCQPRPTQAHQGHSNSLDITLRFVRQVGNNLLFRGPVFDFLGGFQYSLLKVCKPD